MQAPNALFALAELSNLAGDAGPFADARPEQVRRSTRDAALLLVGGSAAYGAAMGAWSSFELALYAAIKLPLLTVYGGEDKLVSTDAIQRWFRSIASADKTLTPYPALFHEVMNEPEKATVLGDITRWLDARV